MVSPWYVLMLCYPVKTIYKCFIGSNILTCTNLFQQIEEISIRSSLFSSDVAKLLAVIMKDVRVNKDVPVKSVRVAKRRTKLMDFRNKKIPPIIITFVQVYRLPFLSFTFNSLISLLFKR